MKGLLSTGPTPSSLNGTSDVSLLSLRQFRNFKNTLDMSYNLLQFLNMFLEATILFSSNKIWII